MKTISLGFITLLLLTVEIHGENDNIRGCTREGMQCRDCYTIGLCEKSETGFSYAPTLNRCPMNSVCDELTWYCERQGYCRYKKFECPEDNYDDEILFPDPYSCVEYHGCEKQNQYDYLCPLGKAFDPVEKKCSLNSDHPSCISNPVPICETDGQTGTIEGTNYLYECVKEDGPPPVFYPRITLKPN